MNTEELKKEFKTIHCEEDLLVPQRDLMAVMSQFVISRGLLLH